MICKSAKALLLISTPSDNVGHRGKGQQLVEKHRTVFLLCGGCNGTGNCRRKKDQILHDVEDDAPREGAVQTLWKNWKNKKTYRSAGA